MTWSKTSSGAYGTEYRRNRETARKRARGYCEQCGHRHPKLQCDHVVPVSQGGTHSVGNLRMLCTGTGSCGCHDGKTQAEAAAGRRGGSRKPADPKPTPRTAWTSDPTPTSRIVWQ